MNGWLRELMQRVRAFFRREELDRELDAEMAAHLDLAITENLERGMSADEARRQALIRFGGTQQAKESHRDARALPAVDALLQDVNFGARMLGKNYSFTGVAVIALALGIGFSSIIFSIFYNGVLHPFPYRDADRLTVIGIVDAAHNSERFREMYHLDEIREFRKLTRTFEDIVAYTGWDPVYSHDGISEPVHGCVLTSNAMEFWGVPPLLGRGIGEADAQPSTSPVALLSYAFWKGHFRGDKSVLGTTITLNKKAYTVVGIMPLRFGLFGADFYAPTNWNRPEAPPEEGGNYFFATALIKRNVARRTAAADLEVVAHQLLATHQRDYPEHFAMTVRPLNEVIVDDFRQTLFLLIAAVVLLLLISSSNVASLLLTHHTARAREIALRAALGASRSRLIRQLFVESLLLGTIGCAFGCFLAYLGLLVVRLVPGVNVPGEADLSLNFPVLVFVVLLSLVTTLFFGLSPAFLAVKRDLRTDLQTSGVNVNASTGGTRIRAGLVVGQVALSMLLLVFAGLMIRSFLAVTDFNPGKRTQGLLYAFIHLPPHQYESAVSQRTLYERLSTRVAALPGVTHTAFSIGLPPLGGPRSEDITIPGKPHEKHWTTAVDAVNESFFPTVGLKLLRGQLFSGDDVAGARRVVVVNTTLVKSFFGDDDPLGRQIKFNVFDEEPDLPHDAWFQIIGVVNDLKGFDPKEAVLPQAYIPRTCLNFTDRRLLVRSVTNPSLLINPLRQIIADVDPDIVVVQLSTLDDELQKHVFMKPKFRLVSFGTCAGIGLGLALIGLFGVMAYSVSLQTHELGVRMALGAQSGNILKLVLRKGFLLVGGGILLGFVTFFFTVRILQSQLWGVSVFDPWTLTLAPIALLGTGLLACYLPARRATRVDPLVALRYE
jgi:predicted permease